MSSTCADYVTCHVISFDNNNTQIWGAYGRGRCGIEGGCIYVFYKAYIKVMKHSKKLELKQVRFSFIHISKNKFDKTWSSVSNSTSVLPLIPTPCSFSPSTVPFNKFRWGLLFLLFLSYRRYRAYCYSLHTANIPFLVCIACNHTNSGTVACKK